MVYRGGLALASTACYRFLTLGKEPEMPLSAQQRQQWSTSLPPPRWKAAR